jgi:hypothetical protein
MVYKITTEQKPTIIVFLLFISFGLAFNLELGMETKTSFTIEKPSPTEIDLHFTFLGFSHSASIVVIYLATQTNNSVHLCRNHNGLEK